MSPFTSSPGLLTGVARYGYSSFSSKARFDVATAGWTLLPGGSPRPVLADGDAVVLIKDLKVKGSSITLKMGTKVKSIRLVGGDHEVDCKMDAGSFMLKACYLRKA